MYGNGGRKQAMKISEIRIKLMEGSEDRLRAFCSITLDDCFVIRDLKIIDGSSGPFVAMPSRKLTGHCQRCHHKNHLRANYCNQCGAKQVHSGPPIDSPQKLYADVAHPINSECREEIQTAIVEEFEAELRRAEQPGYQSRYDDDFEEPSMIPEDPENRTVAGQEVDPDQTSESTLEGSGDEGSGDEGSAGEGPTAVVHGGEPIRRIPKPHFDSDRPDRVTESASPRDEDSFGAGIFD